MKTFTSRLTIAAALFFAAPAMAVAVTPINGGMAGGTLTTINNGPGDQTDPHVSGDVASYTNDGARATIRYYRFSTATDSVVPPGDALSDILSDVSGNRITFSRVATDRNAIFIFDVPTGSLTEIDPTVGSNRLGSAIGGDTVAFVDFATGPGVMFAHDLATNTTVQLSSGTGGAENPSVAPSGNVVVWEQCSSLLNCDVMKSVRSGGVWSAATLVASSSQDPSSDDTWIVYDSDRAGSLTGHDIYFQPLGGGAETQLQIAGIQKVPRISQGIISFESRATAASPADIFIYVIATNTLYQVTSAPSNDQLADVSVLPNGDVRVVWASDDGVIGDYNVYARTFTIASKTPAGQINDLLALVNSFDLKQGIERSLDAKLQNAEQALAQHMPATRQQLAG